MTSTVTIWHDQRNPIAALDREAFKKGKKDLKNFKTVLQFQLPFTGEDAAEEAFKVSNAPDEMLNPYQLHIASLFRKEKVHSVSVGDIVSVDESFFLCESSGWTEL